SQRPPSRRRSRPALASRASGERTQRRAPSRRRRRECTLAVGDGRSVEQLEGLRHHPLTEHRSCFERWLKIVDEASVRPTGYSWSPDGGRGGGDRVRKKTRRRLDAGLRTASSRSCPARGRQVRNRLRVGAKGVQTAGPSPEPVATPAKTKRSHFESAIVARNDKGGASRIEGRG